MNIVELFALQQFIMGTGAAVFAWAAAALITRPAKRAIARAGDRFWDRVDARAAARRR